MMTVYGDGRININTASRQVLGAIPLLSDAAVSEIVSRQKSLARKFSSIADIENSDNFNVTDKLLLTQIAKFNSNHFQLIINIRMKGNSFWCEYVAIIERQGKNTHVLSWQRKSRTMLKNIIHFGVNDNESVSSQG
jgi:type II secretory pathway component PulK